MGWKIWLLAGCLCFAMRVEGQSFSLILPVAGETATEVTGVSNDGQFVSGLAGTESIYRTAFRWSLAGGRADLSAVPGSPPQSASLAISGDGTRVGGQYYTGSGTAQPFRWRVGGAFEPLQGVPGFTNEVLDLSATGDVAVGRVTGGPAQAARWDASGSIQALGFARPGHFYSEAYAVSGDGTTVVGESFGQTTHDAFIWTTEAGMGILTPPAARPQAAARGMNQAGNIIVGNSKPIGSNRAEAVMWIDGVPHDLGLVPGYNRSYAYGVNSDGTAVVGYAKQGINDFASIWTPDTGMILLQDYLSLHGVTMPAHIYSVATGISEDGRTIVGTGRFDGQLRGFVATVPAPASLLPLLGLLALRRSRGTARPLYS